MEELKLQNDSLPSCTTHPNSPIQYYCSVDGCPRSLLCRDCIKSHIHPYLTQDTFIHDLNSALSDETFISCQKKLSSSISSSDHNNAIAAFIESFFAKLQAEILKNIEEAKNSALNTVKNYSENENFPIDALKIELSGLREEYLASEQNSRYEKMEKYIQKYIEINNKVDNAQKMKMPVPVINQEEYERFLATFKKEIQAFSSALLDPSSLVPQIDEKFLQKRAMLQERIPGLIDHGDKVIVNWIGQYEYPLDNY